MAAAVFNLKGKHVVIPHIIYVTEVGRLGNNFTIHMISNSFTVQWGKVEETEKFHNALLTAIEDFYSERGSK